MKLCGNRLKRNLNNGRVRGKRKSSSSSDEGAVFKKMMKQQMQQSVLQQMAQMEEAAIAREEKQELRELQRQQSLAQIGALAPPALPSHPVAQASTPAAPKQVVVPVLSSSPVSGAGKTDSRAVVKQFFNWLVAEQPEED
jgi:hypothetical protein